MAKIGLLDVDGHNFPNLCLMKISAYHKRKGDDVEWWLGLNTYDRVYKSKVFDFTADEYHKIRADEVICGGTGYGLKNKLPRKIERCYPDYSLYGITDTAYGFLTRGCPRGCKFCIVGEKEGRCTKQVADLTEFWQGQKHIKLLDPNLLAAPNADDLLRQLAESKAYVDFTQGLDIRLMNQDFAAILKQTKIDLVHFAWDNPNQNLTGQFARVKKWLGFGHRKLSVYVLTNFNSTHDEDLWRIYTLRELGYDPFVMIYDKESAPQQTRDLQRWVNNRRIFRVCERFEDYEPNRK